MNAIALMYHDVSPIGEQETSGFGGADAARYKLTPAQFEGHLQAIHRRSARAPVTVERLEASVLPVLLTFDDGGESASRAGDALERYGWRGHFFVTTNRIDQRGFLQRRAIRDLRRRGHVIGSHSHTHPLRMSHYAEARLRDEWERSIGILGDMIGEAITCASVPGGYSSRVVLATAAEAGVRFLFTSQPRARAGRIEDTWVLGRYAVQRFTSPAVAAAIAAGDLTPRLRQSAIWAAKSVCKQVGGLWYLRIREQILGRSSGPQWGDDEVPTSENTS